jgi:4-amino-4-deoxy-L-arabinose transferase and related glycosyltransferases of PMT family
MNRLIVIACVLTAFAMIILVFPDGIAALLVVILLSAASVFLFRRFTDEKDLLTNIFLLALTVRLTFGIFVHFFDLRQFFGGDANTFDFFGNQISEYLLGHLSGDDPIVQRSLSTALPGWGINYVVGAIYFLFGRNIFLAQSFCAVFGAATAPMVYFCAKKVFLNSQVAKISAYAVALFPAFVIWSGQLLKDGLIVFLLVLAMTMVLQLQQKLNYAAVAVLVFSMFGILSFRFYIFYLMAVAVVGSFIIGTSNSAQAIVRRGAALLLIGVALTYFGVLRNASQDYGRYGDLEKVQISRADLVKSASSGFGEDVDVSTTTGALSAVPLGFVYLMFAPFPWEMTSFRQAITLPEVLLWWATMPLMLLGIWYTIKSRLRTAFPILLFSVMLTFAYSIFQGNVGTAYRQRTQIQVFLFMFTAVGLTLRKEKRENERLLREENKRRLEKNLRTRMRESANS